MLGIPLREMRALLLSDLIDYCEDIDAYNKAKRQG